MCFEPLHSPMARPLLPLLASLLLFNVAACHGTDDTGSSTESNITAEEHVQTKLSNGLDLIERKATSVIVETTPVSHVYAGGQLIKRKGEPTEAHVVDTEVIKTMLLAIALPSVAPDCGAKLPTSETTFVFKDETNRTMGTVFFDSNHCRDRVGVPEERALYSLFNVGVIVDQAKVDAALAPPAAPEAPSDAKRTE